MTLKNTIRRMLTKYPTLFQDRAQCLNQLFCVIGNGYDWKNGQLVAPNYDDEKPSKGIKIDECMSNLLSNSIDAVVISEEKMFEIELPKYVQYRLYSAYRQDRAMQFINEISNPGFHRFIQASFTFYPICEYSKIVSYPDDIQDDWLEGLKETKLLLNKYGFGSHGHKEVLKFLNKVNKDKRLK